jgi:hypothetical protein
VSGENNRGVGLSVAYAPFDDDPHRFDSDNDGIGCEA